MRAPLRLSIAALIPCLGWVTQVAFASSTPEIVCGQVVRASEGSHVTTRAIYLPDRLRYLQHTMRTLLQSDYLKTLQPAGGLQAVALGDSIVGNTFGAQYGGAYPHSGDAGGTVPIEQYYGATIWTGVAIRGSTGAWYYHVPPQVQNYVLIYQPDLVFIGGISNVATGMTVSEAIADIQDVINQIRAAQPQTEFILMTGAVDLQAVPQSVNLDLDQADPASYEVQLRALAEQVGAGFIDMRHSYNEFIMESNAENPAITQAYFQADPIHANDSEGLPLLHELTMTFFRPAVQCTDRAAPRAPTPNPLALSLSDVQRNPGAVTGLAAADVKGNGLIDLAYFNSTQPGTLLLAPLTSNSTAQLGDVPLHSAVFANLHGAGSALDLVGIDNNGSLRIVYGGQAAAPFASAPKSLPVTGANNVVSFAVLDANQDGRNDIVVALNNGAGLRLYLNEGGATPFTTPTTIDLPAMSGTSQEVRSADVNHDGLPDIVELRSGQAPGNTHLAIRINTGGSALFPLSASYSLPLGSISPTTMALADLDGDSYADLVLGTGASDGNFYVFRNSTREGTWYFDPVSLAKSAQGLCTATLQVADVDGDGRPDIVSANGCAGTSGSVDIYHNSGVIADFQTLTPTTFATRLANVDAATADLHSSGTPDVIVAGADTTGAGAIVQLSSYIPPHPSSPPSNPPPPTPPPTSSPSPPPAGSSSSSGSSGQQGGGGGGAFGGWEIVFSVLALGACLTNDRRRYAGTGASFGDAPRASD